MSSVFGAPICIQLGQSVHNPREENNRPDQNQATPLSNLVSLLVPSRNWPQISLEGQEYQLLFSMPNFSI